MKLTRIGPGVYDDGRGGMHLDFGELLRSAGAADTPKNRAMLEVVWREWATENGRPLTVTDDPITED